MTQNTPQHPYLTDTRLQGLQYIIVPKALLTSAPRLGLDVDDAVMYCVLRSRCDLSLRNGWLDELGRVYIYYTREQMASYLGWGKKKTIDAFRHLTDAGLIVEQAMTGRNHSTAAKRIYVRMWSAPYAEDAVVRVGLSPDDIKNGSLPFLRKENIRAMTGSYYVIPRLLLEHPDYADLPLRAKLLYVITMDQLNLSLEFGQVETLDSGETVPYCHLDRSELIQALQCSERTLTTLFRSLEDTGLMERRRVSFQPELRVYLRDFLPAETPENPPSSNGDDGAPFFSHSQDAKIEPRTRKNRTPETQNPNPRDAETAPSATQKTNVSIPSSVNLLSELFLVNLAAEGEAPEQKKEIFSLIWTRLDGDQISADLVQLCPPGRLDPAREILTLAIEILAEDVCFSGRKIRLGEEFVEKRELLAEYGKLDRWTLTTMVLKIAEQPKIRQLKQYIHRSLFTAADKHAGESYYTRLRLEGPPPSPAPTGTACGYQINTEMAELARRNREQWARCRDGACRREEREPERREWGAMDADSHKNGASRQRRYPAYDTAL